jgi:hypothetical protein
MSTTLDELRKAASAANIDESAADLLAAQLEKAGLCVAKAPSKVKKNELKAGEATDEEEATTE